MGTLSGWVLFGFMVWFWGLDPRKKYSTDLLCFLYQIDKMHLLGYIPSCLLPGVFMSDQGLFLS